MSFYRNLKPHVRVLELLGGTGDGKTVVATVPADPVARRILLKGVGKTNSTLTDRLFVYTTQYQDRMIVAAKPEDDIISRNLFTEILTKAFASVVRVNGKVVMSIIGKEEEDLAEHLTGEMNRKNNIKAVLSFLTEEQHEDFVRRIVQLYHDYKLNEDNYEIYNTVKNSMPESEVKETSQKFLAAIQAEVQRYLDLRNDGFKDELWKVWQETNDKLKSVFFNYFNEKDKSDDGYYFKEIILSEPDKDFIEAMFTSNDIQNGEKLSLEVMCKEIVIYIPLDRRIAEIIQKSDKAKNVFCDSHGNTVLGLLDTRGLFHANSTENENTDYFSELLYRNDVDALVMVVPLYGDSNEKKINELYRDVIRNFNKQLPIFMLHNKLDLFVDWLNKERYDDPLSLEDDVSEELSTEEIRQKIYNREKSLREDLQNVQVKARKHMEIKSLSCYLKRDKNLDRMLVREFNVVKAFETIINDVSEYLKESAVKITIKVKDAEDVRPRLEEKRFGELVRKHIKENTTDKKVFTPGMADIAKNLGLTPHGSAYNALRRRLRVGDGYTSNINEEYFYNCKSFSVNFTANLRNFASDELLRTLIYSTLTIDGARFENQKDDEEFMSKVQAYVNPKELVSLLLYDHAMLEAEKTAFSFKSKFQNFLQNSMRYFNLTQINEDQYTAALELMILNAADRALNFNTIYR